MVTFQRPEAGKVGGSSDVWSAAGAAAGNRSHTQVLMTRAAEAQRFCGGEARGVAR